jgi:hypothetical protein
MQGRQWCKWPGASTPTGWSTPSSSLCHGMPSMWSMPCTCRARAPRPPASLSSFLRYVIIRNLIDRCGGTEKFARIPRTSPFTLLIADQSANEHHSEHDHECNHVLYKHADLRDAYSDLISTTHTICKEAVPHWTFTSTSRICVSLSPIDSITLLQIVAGMPFL